MDFDSDIHVGCVIKKVIWLWKVALQQSFTDPHLVSIENSWLLTVSSSNSSSGHSNLASIKLVVISRERKKRSYERPRPCFGFAHCWNNKPNLFYVWPPCSASCQVKSVFDSDTAAHDTLLTISVGRRYPPTIPHPSVTSHHYVTKVSPFPYIPLCNIVICRHSVSVSGLQTEYFCCTVLSLL